MARSQRVSVSQMEGVYQLLGECAELWADPAAWRKHLCLGAARLVGAELSFYAEMESDPGVSRWYQEYIRSGRDDESVIAVRSGASGGVSILAVERSAGAPPFTEGAVALLDYLLGRVMEMAGVRLASEEHRSLDGLARRPRQTLERLLEGDSEKQIALKLGLSGRTVHHYVEMLHEHFGVASRGELMAYFVHRRPVLRKASHNGRHHRSGIE